MSAVAGAGRHVSVMEAAEAFLDSEEREAVRQLQRITLVHDRQEREIGEILSVLGFPSVQRLDAPPRERLLAFGICGVTAKVWLRVDDRVDLLLPLAAFDTAEPWREEIPIGKDSYGQVEFVKLEQELTRAAVVLLRRERQRKCQT